MLKSKFLHWISDLTSTSIMVFYSYENLLIYYCIDDFRYHLVDNNVIQLID